ncbi:MAG: hypothetical protein V7607_4500 [Solirubrobacteraceae bacterium]
MTTRGLQSTLLERLRALMPRRALTHSEALQIAERQAGLLLSCLGIATPPLPLSVLAELAFITIDLRPGFPTSGLATRTKSGWVIALNEDEPEPRQAFSLGHELKHVLDDPFIDRLYPSSGGYSSHERAERVCDYFAACLLMPKRLVTSDWCSGRQDIKWLAARYRVSRQAMGIRLSQLGLSAPTPRCAWEPHGAAP